MTSINIIATILLFCFLVVSRALVLFCQAADRVCVPATLASKIEPPDTGFDPFERLRHYNNFWKI